jgi:hypothetical protein
VQQAAPDVHAKVVETKEGLFSEYQFVNKAKLEAADVATEQQAELVRLESQTKQRALTKIAILPVIMCACYLVLIAYFRSRGGYRAEVLTGHEAKDEKFTGGTIGPVEA